MIHPDVGTLAILFSLFRFNNSTCTCTKKIGRDKTNPFSIASYTLCVIVPLATVVIAGTAIVVILLRKPKLSAQLQRLVTSLGELDHCTVAVTAFILELPSAKCAFNYLRKLSTLVSIHGPNTGVIILEIASPRLTGFNIISSINIISIPRDSFLHCSIRNFHNITSRIRAACVTTLLIVGAYFACVMPYTIAFIIWNKKHKSKESLMYESWPLYCKYNLPRHCQVLNLNFPFEKMFVHF